MDFFFFCHFSWRLLSLWLKRGPINPNEKPPAPEVKNHCPILYPVLYPLTYFSLAAFCVILKSPNYFFFSSHFSPQLCIFRKHPKGRCAHLLKSKYVHLKTFNWLCLLILRMTKYPGEGTFMLVVNWLFSSGWFCMAVFFMQSQVLR